MLLKYYNSLILLVHFSQILGLHFLALIDLLYLFKLLLIFRVVNIWHTHEGITFAHLLTVLEMVFLGSTLAKLVLTLRLQLLQGLNSDAVGDTSDRELLQTLLMGLDDLVRSNELIVWYRENEGWASIEDHGLLWKGNGALQLLTQLFHVKLLEIVVGHKSLDFLEKL